MIALMVLMALQSIAAQFDLDQFPLGPVVGIPIAVDTDDDPATKDWLVRYQRFSIRGVSGDGPPFVYESVVVRLSPTVCIGQPFLASDAPIAGEVQYANRRHAVTVRAGLALTVYDLHAPECEPRHDAPSRSDR